VSKLAPVLTAVLTAVLLARCPVASEVDVVERVLLITRHIPSTTCSRRFDIVKNGESKPGDGA
jgi:hypothetical protein